MELTKEEIIRRTEVMLAYTKGHVIQSKSLGNEFNSDWQDDITPSFRWDLRDYRAIPDNWRAEKNGTYYYIKSSLEVESAMELKCDADNKLYDSGNYFQTEDDARYVLIQVKGIFRNSHRTININALDNEQTISNEN